MNTLWLLEIDCNWDQQRVDKALGRLPTEVQGRANRYRCQRARRNLVVTQTCLHQVLESLEIDVGMLVKSANGRPQLGGSDWEFNLSHSEDRAVLALGRGMELRLGLGVDLEYVDRPVEKQQLAQRFFSPQESAQVCEDSNNFFQIWTRKEAVLKSNGVGLRVELSSFEVLGHEVAQEISGQPLVLGSQIRGRYVVSWAVARSWGPFQVQWAKAFDDEHWKKRLLEGIGT